MAGTSTNKPKNSTTTENSTNKSKDLSIEISYNQSYKQVGQTIVLKTTGGVKGESVKAGRLTPYAANANISFENEQLEISASLDETSPKETDVGGPFMMELVDNKREGSYFQNLESNENEVIRLENAIEAISKSLESAPYRHDYVYCRDWNTRKRKVKLGEAVAYFSPDRKNIWDFKSSGILVFFVGMAVEYAVSAIISIGSSKIPIFAKKVMGKVEKAANQTFDNTLGLISRRGFDRILNKIGKGAFRQDETVEKINKVTGGNVGIALSVFDPVAEIIEDKLYLRNQISGETTDVETDVCDMLGAGDIGERPKSIPRKINGCVGKGLGWWKKYCKALKIHGGIVSELPYVYQVTEQIKAFKDAYPSNSVRAVHAKFGVYAAIVEDMVNRWILGWKFTNKESGTVQVVKYNTEMFEQYFKELNISIEEIKTAVEILDGSIYAYSGYCHKWVGEVETVDGKEEFTDVYGVRVTRNMCGALRVEKGATKDKVVRMKNFEFSPDMDNGMDNGKERDRPWIGWDNHGLIIMGNVENVGAYAFYKSKVKSLTIRDGVKEIGEYAFYGCDNIESVTIPQSVEKIGEKAFGNCIKLKYVYCRVKYIGGWNNKNSGFQASVTSAFAKDVFVNDEKKKSINNNAHLYVHELVLSEFKALWGDSFKTVEKWKG